MKRIDVIAIDWNVPDAFYLVRRVNQRNVVSNVVGHRRWHLDLVSSSFSLGNLRTYSYEYRLYGTNKEILQQ